jgi:hypothetical protein
MMLTTSQRIDSARRTHVSETLEGEHGAQGSRWRVVSHSLRHGDISSPVHGPDPTIVESHFEERQREREYRDNIRHAQHPKVWIYGMALSIFYGTSSPCRLQALKSETRRLLQCFLRLTTDVVGVGAAWRHISIFFFFVLL